MKKKIAGMLGLALLSTGALASKARLQALGEDTYGSFFIDDARNVTLNPAMLNLHKDFVTMEWGNTDTGSTTISGVSAGSDTDQDLASSPKAEGGLFRASGNMIYGIYFGDESNTANSLRTLAMGANAIHESNNLSLYVAGDAGVQWGVKLTSHSYTDKQSDDNDKSSASRVTIGINSGDIESFLAVGLSNTAEKGSAEFEGKGAYQLGLTYAMGDIDYLLDFRSIQIENAAGNELKVQYTRLGVAKTYKLNDKATAWASAWYRLDNTENDLTTGTESESKLTYLPVMIGTEVMVKDWLSLRGSVGGNIIGTEEDINGKEKTIDNSTQVAAGVGLIFGDLVLDGMIGNTDNNQTVGENTTGGVGTLRTDVLMSRVSMTYKF